MKRVHLLLALLLLITTLSYSEIPIKFGINAGLSQPILNFGSEEKSIEKSGYAQTGYSFEADLILPTESKKWEILISCLYNSNSLDYGDRNIWSDSENWMSFVSSNSKKYTSVTPLFGLQYKREFHTKTELYFAAQLGVNFLSMNDWEDELLWEPEIGDVTFKEPCGMETYHGKDQTLAFSVAIGLIYNQKFDLKVRYLNIDDHSVIRRGSTLFQNDPLQQRSRFNLDSLDRSVSILMLTIGYII